MPIHHHYTYSTGGGSKHILHQYVYIILFGGPNDKVADLCNVGIGTQVAGAPIILPGLSLSQACAPDFRATLGVDLTCLRLFTGEFHVCILDI